MPPKSAVQYTHANRVYRKLWAASSTNVKDKVEGDPYLERERPSPLPTLREELLPRFPAEYMDSKVPSIDHRPSTADATLVVRWQRQRRVGSQELAQWLSWSARVDEHVHTVFLTMRMTDSMAPRFSVPSFTWSIVYAQKQGMQY